jgi:hypothetical protein
VRRNGYYGKYREFVRWQCVPGNGDAPHYLSRSLRSEPFARKLVGGVHAGCDECEREWTATDGMPSASYDKFVLRAKAEMLLGVAHGLSIRGAANGARMAAVERRTGRRPLPWSVSRDGRLGRDWVSRYTGLLADALLPKRWPETIVVDSFDVRIPTFDADGFPLKKGRYLYSVFLAVGYPRGNRRGAPWLAAAFAGESEREWREFFRLLPGKPTSIVCDGSWAIRNAAAWAFPKATVYPCAWHLFDGLFQRLRAAGLWNNRRLIYRLLEGEEDNFTDPARWARVEDALRRYLNADRSKLPPKTADALEALERWLTRNEEKIAVALAGAHWPPTIGHVEEHLDTIQSRLGDRRRAFRNLPRLNCVLNLMLLHLRGQASVPSWARILRDHHQDGKPAGRPHDGQIIRVPRSTITHRSSGRRGSATKRPAGVAGPDDIPF